MLDDYAGITMAEVKAERDRILTLLQACVVNPGVNSQAGLALSSKQHQNWLGEFLASFCFNAVRQVLEACEEDHMGDGVVQYFCLLLEYSSATGESIMVAEAKLHPNKLDLENFDQSMKNWLHHIRENCRMIMGSGGQIGNSVLIHMHTALAKSHTKQFRLQLMQWATNWR